MFFAIQTVLENLDCLATNHVLACKLQRFVISNTTIQQMRPDSHLKRGDVIELCHWGSCGVRLFDCMAGL